MGYAISPKTSINAELEIVQDKFTHVGNLNYTVTITATNSNTITNDYRSIDKYDLHSTINSVKEGFDHKFNNSGHNLTGGFMLGYEGGALEYFESALFNKDNQREQGHQAW